MPYCYYRCSVCGNTVDKFRKVDDFAVYACSATNEDGNVCHGRLNKLIPRALYLRDELQNNDEE